MRFGNYEVIRLIGRGGMSEVYEVENVRLGSRHALKIYAYDKDANDVRERFIAEGKLLARLCHPRIVRVVDVGSDEEGGRPYFVMELVRDESGQVRSLANIQPGTIDEDTVGKWYDDLRSGLDYIHSHGIIHRDLKLQNVLIGPDGHVVLVDFGISKVVDSAGDGNRAVDILNTVIKVRDGRSLLMGSIGYLAPELEMGVSASRQSDFYALGVIVYRLLTGMWYDARTDVASALETYGPVWGRIVPRLLHANPQGRECLSYADERAAECERREFELEERLAARKRRGLVARRWANWIAAAILLTTVVIDVFVVRQSAAVRRQVDEVGNPVANPGVADRRLQYEFDHFFKVDIEVLENEQTDPSGALRVPSSGDLDAAKIDLLVLTYDTFRALNAGDLKVRGAIDQMERMYRALHTGTFANWPPGYMPLASDEVDCWLLDIGIQAMKGLEYKQ